MWSNYKTTYELLACVNPPGSSIGHSSSPETVPVLPWIPLTTAAVALRLLEFDSSLSYILQQKAESQDQGSRDIKVSLSSSCPEFRLNQIGCFCDRVFLTSFRHRGGEYSLSLRMDMGHNMNTVLKTLFIVVTRKCRREYYFIYCFSTLHVGFFDHIYIDTTLGN